MDSNNLDKINDDIEHDFEQLLSSSQRSRFANDSNLPDYAFVDSSSGVNRLWTDDELDCILKVSHDCWDIFPAVV